MAILLDLDMSDVDGEIDDSIVSFGASQESNLNGFLSDEFANDSKLDLISQSSHQNNNSYNENDLSNFNNKRGFNVKISNDNNNNFSDKFWNIGLSDIGSDEMSNVSVRNYSNKENNKVLIDSKSITLFENLNTLIEKLTEEKNALSNANIDLMDQMKEIEQKNAELKEEIEKKNQSFVNLQGDFQKQQKELENNKSLINNLKEDLNEYNNRKSAAGHEISKLQTQNSFLNERIKELNNLNNAKNAEIEELKTQISLTNISFNPVDNNLQSLGDSNETENIMQYFEADTKEKTSEKERVIILELQDELAIKEKKIVDLELETKQFKELSVYVIDRVNRMLLNKQFPKTKTKLTT
eukprot:TRINITY_DN2205_c0_g1_i1.p1 TRINITY_DN2205_c0_g1~~TRINITY_DN2205_c0_g1_i1.p1  ORF type:complete len:354 (-),score=118.94 TRINITY_DN2205_c0_g1_i1:555-1616(-)